MKPTISKAFWLLFSLLLAAHVAPNAFASGADDDCDDLECSSFFAPEVIQRPDETPFFRSDRTFYQHAYDVGADALANTAAVNVREWHAYLGGAMKEGTVAWLLYKMTGDDLANLVSTLGGKDAPLSDQGKVLLKLFRAYGHKEKVLGALRYLQFAKKVEPIATRRSGDDGWDPNEGKKHLGEDTATADALIASVPALARGADAFVQDRLRLQVIRLYFYTARFDLAESYYEANLGQFSGNGSARWRFLETAAGAFYKDKKYGKANYLYSLVFGEFASEKRSAYFSFHPVEQADWNESLSLARNAREKAVLWQLLGIYADGMAAIDQIAALDPKSDLLPLLLVREVNKAEENWSSNRDLIKYSSGDPSFKPKSDEEAVGVARLSRLRALADAGKVSRLYLWRLSVGHLLALSGDHAAADRYLRASSEGMPRDPVLYGQARSSLLLNRVLSLHAADKGAEDYLARELTWLGAFQCDQNFRARNLRSFVLAQLSELYLAGGDVIRGLMLDDHKLNPAYRDVARTEALLAFPASARTAFDKFLVKNYQYSQAELRELQALAALYRGDFASARNFLKLGGAAVENHALYADPFTARITDCHDCEIGQNPVMTRAQFVDRLIALRAQAQGTGQAAAEAALLLGNGLYNMSYYGNGRSVFDVDHGNLNPDKWSEQNLDGEPTMNMDLAERAYERAASLSGDKEFRARATFLAAKTEQNRYYNTHRKDDGSDIHPGKYYGQLKSEFSDTQYFQEIIKECGYFKTWISK